MVPSQVEGPPNPVEVYVVSGGLLKCAVRHVRRAGGPASPRDPISFNGSDHPSLSRRPMLDHITRAHPDPRSSSPYALSIVVCPQEDPSGLHSEEVVEEGRDQIMRHAPLSPRQKAILAAVRAEPGQSLLAEDLGMCNSALLRMLRSLEARGKGADVV